MAKRTGVPSLIDVAHELCRLLAKFSALITKLYEGNDALIAALTAAQIACAALEAELLLVRDFGD